MGKDGAEVAAFPRHLEGRGKSCAGNIISLAKVPGKCQNKMCWLRSGNEKSTLGCPATNPSISQHPSQAEELVTFQFFSAPRTVPPECPFCISAQALVYHAETGTKAKGRDTLLTLVLTDRCSPNAQELVIWSKEED